MSRRAGTNFQTPALFGIDDERQLEFPEDTQSRVIGGQVEQLDVIALGVLGSGARAAGFRDRLPHLEVEHEQPLHPRRGLGPGSVPSARTNIGSPPVGAIHQRLLEQPP